jgi:hypothetical protein
MQGPAADPSWNDSSVNRVKGSVKQKQGVLETIPVGFVADYAENTAKSHAAGTGTTAGG